MTPAELYDDHRRRPRNLGKLASAHAVGDVGSIVAGDALRFYLGLEGERITAAKFQVFNCQGQVAAASVASELVIGRTIDEALALGPRDVRAHLGGLANEQLPPQLWALEGLRAAVATLRGGAEPADLEVEPMLCPCLGTSVETVRQAILVGGHATLDAVVAATGAGRDCGACLPDIRRLVDDPSGRGGKAEAKPAAKDSGVAGRIPTLHRIGRILSERVAAEATAAGGSIELWDFDGRTVSVRLRGAFATDAAAARPALELLERLLRAEIDATIGVAVG